jgi:hypothetical protein
MGLEVGLLQYEYNTLSQPPQQHSSHVSLVARPLLTPVAQELYRCERGIVTCRTCAHSRTVLRIEIVLAVRVAFSSAYSDEEVLT